MYDVVCFSHLRWDFVFQRPQHLLSRCGQEQRVFYVEEPIWSDEASWLKSYDGGSGVEVLTPVLKHGLTPEEAEHTQLELLRRAFTGRQIEYYVLWMYTPMAVPLAQQLHPAAVIYDCMDELSAFKDAPPELIARERELFRMADVVFTGGHALYEAKSQQHANVHAFPSSVDVAHFGQARRTTREPVDQAQIPGPRLGFCGVVDERMDLALLKGIAEERPDWQLVVLGPVVKIAQSELPRLSNLHYLGAKKYAELPDYIAGWDVALMPFAKNESTRFISPTKTPEYLAAGKPVVSTSIKDVIRTYGESGLCHIADTVGDFVAACERALLEKDSQLRLKKVDDFLSHMSWDDTWQEMANLVDIAVRARLTRSGTYLRSKTAAKVQRGSAGR